MIIFELLAVIIGVLVLLYLAFFSPWFDRVMKRLFGRNPETADGIANQVRDIEAEKAAARAALTARNATLKAEADKLSKINVK